MELLPPNLSAYFINFSVTPVSPVTSVTDKAKTTLLIYFTMFAVICQIILLRFWLFTLPLFALSPLDRLPPVCPPPSGLFALKTSSPAPWPADYDFPQNPPYSKYSQIHLSSLFLQQKVLSHGLIGIYFIHNAQISACLLTNIYLSSIMFIVAGYPLV